MQTSECISRNCNALFRDRKSAAYVPLTGLFTCRLLAAYPLRLRFPVRKPCKAPVLNKALSQDLWLQMPVFAARKATGA